VPVSLTTALAIYGASLSTVTVLIALIRERQNRPDLRVSLTWEFEGEEPGGPLSKRAAVIVEVVNAGRHPTTVQDVYVIWAPPDGPGEILLDRDDEPRILGPHQTARWTRNLWNTLPVVPVDVPARARVTDALGNEIWSRPELVLREFAECGWQPEGSAAELLEPRPELRVAAPLHPRWHVWRRKDLRAPTPLELAE
jgi:hypothetical protein